MACQFLLVICGFLVLALGNQAGAVSDLRLDWYYNPSPNNPDKLWYHLAGSLAGLKRYTYILTGKDVHSEAELDNHCLYEIWLPKANDKTANWTQLGFGHKVEWACLTTAASSIAECKLLEGQKSKFNKTSVHVTLTDNETFLLYVETWEDGLKDWHAVVPLNLKVSEENMKAVLHHARMELGFKDEADFFYHSNYTACPTINA